ncbi:hypothetical protein C0992_006585 [Termitomyces sp. T32_za158]|nr:hypothetical protein C0992_006585 [Termitomyces sp. T32_za158]
MPPQLDDKRKRQLMASPEKQEGVKSHVRKRRNPAPPNHPTPPSMASLTISGGNHHDTDGDTTMVNQSQTYLPNRETPYSPNQGTPTPGSRSDPAWIIRRMPVTPAEPPFTQAESPSLRPLRPTPQLPRSLTRTPTPIGGFPTIHLLTPPWFNLLPKQRTIFDQYPEPKLWIRDWQASNMTDLMATSDKLKDLLLRMTGERIKLSTPQQEKDIITKKRYDKQKPPYHFLASGMSERANGILLAHPIISTPDASAFILPYNPPLSGFLCTIEGFTLSIRNQDAVHESENTATEIVRKTLLENEVLINLLKSKLTNDDTSQHNLEPATKIISLLEVKLAKGEEAIDRSTSYKPRKPLWNVFFQRPPPNYMDELLYPTPTPPGHKVC